MTENTIREVPTPDGRTVVELTGPGGIGLEEKRNPDASLRAENPVDLAAYR